MSSATNYVLGELRLDPANECLWRADVAIPLRPKAYALLLYLVENPGRILTKEELLDAVWGHTIVGDSVLKVCVRELRKALDDSTSDPRFIETIHRRGYRFRGPVPPSPGAGVSSAAEPRPAPETTPAPLPALVGRAAELERLGAHLAAAERGERRVVFVTGGPGIGKTALIQAFAGSLEESSALWLGHGQCLDQFGTGEAYLPVLDALSRLCRGAEGEALTRLLRERAPTWLAQMPWLLDEGDRSSLETDLFGATQARMLREMVEALETLTLERTLVLVLEDMHWADPSTVDWIAAFARRSGPARVLLLCTLRPVELILADHPLKRVKRELEVRRLSDELQLAHMNPSQTSAFVATLLGGVAPPDELGAWAHAHTDGNPLFLVNLVDSLRERQVLMEADGGWQLSVNLDEERVPESVLALVDDMVERRSDEEQRALEACSVAGAEFCSAAVAAILEEPQDAVEERCARLARVGHFLLPLGSFELPDGTPVERYRFAHAVYGAALLRRIPAARLRRYHERNAERGAAAYGERVGEIAGELALAYENAGDPARAVRLLAAAGKECARRYANREACSHLEHALVLCERLQGEEGAAARVETLEQLGLVHRSAGNMVAAADTFAPMAAAARLANRGADVVRALLYEASAASWHDRKRCLEAIESARTASSELPDGLLRRHASGAAGYWRLLWNGRDEADARACEAARAAAHAAGDRALESLHTVRVAWFHWLGGRYRDAVRSAREGATLSAELGESFDYLLGQYFHAWSLLHSGAWGAMRRVLGEALGMAERNGHESWTVLFRLLEAWLHHEARDFEGALRLAEVAGERAEELGHAYPRLLADTILGLAYLGTNDVDRAFACFDRVRDDSSQEILMGWTLRMIASAGWTRAQLHRGEPAAALEEAHALVQIAERTGERTAAALARRTLAEIAAGDGDSKAAQREIGLALDHLEGEPAPLAAWRVHLAAMEILGDDEPELRDLHRQAAIRTMEALADACEPGDPLRETLRSDPDFEGLEG